MNDIILAAIESHARPRQQTLALQESEETVLWALPLNTDSSKGLRRTVFRPPDRSPPQGATRILRLRADEHGLIVVSTNPRVQIELQRIDHRSRLVSGMRLPVHASLELSLADSSRIDVTLSIQRSARAGGEITVGGGGSRKSRVVYSADNIWWIITDSKGLIVTFGINLWDKARDRLMALGIDSRVLSFMSGIILSAGAGIYLSATQYQRAESEAERAQTAETALNRANAAQEASLATEMACLEQRKTLVEELGKQDAQHRLAAEMALGFALANKAAVEIGGGKMGEPRLLEADQLLNASVIDAVVNAMQDSPGEPEACQAQHAALSNDLPPYLLLYHPDPELVCPLDYAVVDGGVDRRGRFGLSDRVAREFGHAGNTNTGTTTETLDELLGDPRMEDRWSAFTTATAYRSTLSILLKGARTDRPPALPSQAHLWALALFDAYNHMPSTPQGALDSELSVCLTRLLNQRVEHAGPAAPGDPVLPDIIGVARGDIEFPAIPTPGCPWPSDSVTTGAQNALRTAGRLAALNLGD